MKKVLLTLSVVLTICASATAQDFTNAGQYLDYINQQQLNISKKFLAYTSASAHGKRERKVESLRNKLLDEIQTSRSNLMSMPMFNKDRAFRDSAVNFTKFYYSVLNEDYAKIVNMEEIAERSFDEMEIYINFQEAVDKKLEEANDRMKNAQRKFAADNNITLVDGKNEISEMMRQVGKMNEYYHDVYLLFFKPYIQERNMLDALKQNNLVAAQQAQSALLKYANESLEALKAQPAFNGDGSLVAACKTMVNFWIKEANGMAPIMDLSLAKEKFEAQKKEYEKGKRTKESVEAYNAAVNEVNKASDASNRANENFNNQRSQALDNWNQTVKNFHDTHTPHYK